MTLPVLCFIFGAVLVLLGFGTDAEVMGIKVPRIPLLLRPFSFVAGVALMALPILRPGTFERPLNVFIYEELGQTQDSEDLEITINDTYAGSIALHRPNWRAILAVPATGKLAHYKLKGRASEKANNNKIVQTTSVGEGSIDLTEPAVYAVATKGFANGIYTLDLEKLQ